MPVLARIFEDAGMPTVLVTNMPFWSERVGAPRSLGVEFPFGHIIGPAGDRVMQRRVILHALDVLEKAEGPGTIEHSRNHGPNLWRWPGAGRNPKRHRRSRPRWAVTSASS